MEAIVLNYLHEPVGIGLIVQHAGALIVPHGSAFGTRPELAWAHAAGDAAIGAAFIAIAAALVSLVRRRDDIAFGRMVLCVTAFLLLTGITHLLSVWTLWNPDHGVHAVVKLATALVAALTAVALWPLIPKALALPSPEHLRAANSALQAEIAERLRTEAMLRHAQKLEAVGQLTGGVAHDFNNLLTVIGGNVELAGRAADTGDADRIARYLTTAMTGVGQAKLLTGQLLAFARRQTLDARPVNVNALIGDMSGLLTRALGDAVEVRALPGSRLGTVEVDRNQLEAALLNLALNARDAMTRSEIAAGILTIETANVAIGNVAIGDCAAKRHRDVPPGDYVLIAIGDTGTGMARDVAERAPEPFFTTKAAGQGTGLGLAQVFGFVEQSNGHIRIDSDVGAGTTVRIYLPRVDAPSAVAPASATGATGAIERAKGESVLVVEDDANVRAYVVESLRDIGYTVTEASDAADALAELDRGQREGDAPVDLLLTDVVMPRMSGRVLVDTARARHKGLRVLYMTGYARSAVAKRGRLDAGVTMISKPFTLGELAGKVREVLEASASEGYRTKIGLMGETRC